MKYDFKLMDNNFFLCCIYVCFACIDPYIAWVFCFGWFYGTTGECRG